MAVCVTQSLVSYVLTKSLPTLQSVHSTTLNHTDLRKDYRKAPHLD